MSATPPAATWKMRWGIYRVCVGRQEESDKVSTPEGEREGEREGGRHDLRKDLLCQENGAVSARQHHFRRPRPLAHLPRLLAVT